MRYKKKTWIYIIAAAFLMSAAVTLVIVAAIASQDRVLVSEDVASDSAEKPRDENEDTTEESAEAEELTAIETGETASHVTVAWQPSHQDDTGDAEWHEYLICNDIVERAMLLCNKVRSVKCWDTSHGLTGTNNYRPNPTNTQAFDVELSIANSAKADYFISIHNDGGAPSGILGICMPGDQLSRSFLEKFLASLCAHTGLPSRGIWEVRLYSLEPELNSCPCRILLEIGDNESDRALLEDEGFRQKAAQALAEVANGLAPLR